MHRNNSKSLTREGCQILEQGSRCLSPLVLHFFLLPSLHELLSIPLKCVLVYSLFHIDICISFNVVSNKDQCWQHICPMTQPKSSTPQQEHDQHFQFPSCTEPLNRSANTKQHSEHAARRRAKRQLGQRGHNLSGNSAAKPPLTFGGSLE